jgi:hypothetical protein
MHISVFNVLTYTTGMTLLKEDESSTERVWAAGFHQVTARCGLARVLKLVNG